MKSVVIEIRTLRRGASGCSSHIILMWLNSACKILGEKETSSCCGGCEPYCAVQILSLHFIFLPQFPSLSGDENYFVELLMRGKKKKKCKNVSRNMYLSLCLGHQFLVHKMSSHIRCHARSTLQICGLLLCFILQQSIGDSLYSGI